MTGRPLVLAALLVSALGAVPARAQGAGDAEGGEASEAAPKDPKLAKKHVQAAVQATQKGDAAARRKQAADAKAAYQNAVLSYAKAIQASDDVNLHYDLALVEEKLGRLDAAVRHLRIVTAKDGGARADVIKKASSKLDDLSMQVAFVTLQIDPDDATISIGSEVVGKAPMSEPLVLMPGTYTLSVASDGYQPKDSELKVEAGAELERTVQLEPIKVVVAPIEEKPETRPAVVPQPPSKLPLYVGAGATGAALVTTIVAGTLAVGKHGTFTSADATPDERADAKASGKNLALISDVALGATVVAAGVTVVWYVAKYRPARARYAESRASSDDTAKVQVVPWVQPDAGGLTFAGSF